MTHPLIEYENLAKVNQSFRTEFEAAFATVLDSGWFILGKSLAQFEDHFAAYCGVPHCIGVGSGLDAIRIALEACRLRPGGEVIVAGNAYIACAMAILQAGLTPKLVEPDPHTYNLDPGCVAEAINGQTVALMAVHLYGKMCDMDRLSALATQHGLCLIEDAAQAHGASLHGRKAGSWGHCAAFSFYPTKNLGALGDGGAILTASPAIAEQARILRNYGSDRKYHNGQLGYNSRLDDLQAAFLTVKLQHLDGINQHKSQLAALYYQHLGNGIVKPQITPGYRDVHHIYAVRHPERDQLREYLRQHQILTEIHYPIPPHQQPGLQQWLGNVPLPISEQLAQTELSLPISYSHTEADVQRVVEVLNEF